MYNENFYELNKIGGTKFNKNKKLFVHPQKKKDFKS